MSKSTTIATVNNTTIATVKNSEKTNTVLTHESILNAYIDNNINCTHDTSGYCGVDNGKNNTIVFSPNYKKTQTNIYCSELVYNTLKTIKFENTTLCENSNITSKTIPYTIICKSQLDFNEMLKSLVSNNLVRLLPTK